MPNAIKRYKATCEVGRKPTRHEVYDSKRYNDPALARAARFRNRASWQKVRRATLMQSPICVDPFKDHPGGEHAQDVHHVIPLIEEEGCGLMEENLRTLCRACHNKVERMYRTDGYKAKRLFLSEEDETRLLDRARGHLR